MIDQGNIRKAINIALTSHSDQVDKKGIPYILHPMAVANLIVTLDYEFPKMIDLEVAIPAAILHDTLEDSPTPQSTSTSMRMILPTNIVDVVKILTYNKDVPYNDFIESIIESGNINALAVKLCDCKHNLDRCKLYGLSDLANKYYIPHARLTLAWLEAVRKSK